MTESIITRYAKKIYGFAYSKTHNYNDACDLSQDILLEVCKTDFTKKEIADLDGYIYRLCQYTWSNHVRKNKSHWDNTFYCDVVPDVLSDESLEEQVLKTDLYDNLRREVMFLAKTKRDVTVMFYYEGKSSREISEILGIPDATVRWHLGEAKKKIREKIEMENNIYTPKKLTLGFSGNCFSEDMKGLLNDLLVQNICLVCQGKALTIEEIAHELCMSAAFIEEKLDNMLLMNYLEKVGNKYRCTFFIRDGKFISKMLEFYKNTSKRIADVTYSAVKKRFNEIISIGFMGCDLDPDFLMWTFVGEALFAFTNEYADFEWAPPKRGDGSEFYVIAAPVEINDLTPELKEYREKSLGSCGKHCHNDRICMRQHEPACVIPLRGLWRREAVTDIEKVYNYIVTGKELDAFDKETVASVCANGFAKVENEKISLTVPFFTRDQLAQFESIMKEAAREIYEAEGGIFAEFAEYTDKLLPDYVTGDEREFWKARYAPVTNCIYELYLDGSLKELSEEEKKAICTIIME